MWGLFGNVGLPGVTGDLGQGTTAAPDIWGDVGQPSHSDASDRGVTLGAKWGLRGDSTILVLRGLVGLFGHFRPGGPVLLDVLFGLDELVGLRGSLGGLGVESHSREVG